jgi:biotin carboxylase
VERVLLLLPTSTYRTRDFLEAARKVGAEVVVASEERSTMEPLQEGSLLTLDFLAPDRAADVVASFHRRHPISAIVAVDEETAVAAATVSRALGLRHNPPESALRARLKHRMREALAASGVPQPAFRVLKTDEEAHRAAEEMRYPSVLKPVFLSGSRGVVRVDDQEGFLARFRWLREFLATEEMRRHGGGDAGLVLVEDYVSGPEVALEGLLTEGRLRSLALFDKPDPLEGPFFEETIYVTPSRHPEEMQRKVLEVTARATEAIGLREGPIHAELRLSREGPTVIEVAGRSIGGLCSRALRFGLGITLEELILRHALGKDVSALAREAGASGVMMIPIPRRGELAAVEGLDEARALPGIVEVAIAAHPGQELVPLPEGSSYLGFVFARAERPEAVEHALRGAHRRLRFRFAGEPQ